MEIGQVRKVSCFIALHNVAVTTLSYPFLTPLFHDGQLYKVNKSYDDNSKKTKQDSLSYQTGYVCTLAKNGINKNF